MLKNMHFSIGILYIKTQIIIVMAGTLITVLAWAQPLTQGKWGKKISVLVAKF
jgi:hypothetical protein